MENATFFGFTSSCRIDLEERDLMISDTGSTICRRQRLSMIKMKCDYEFPIPTPMDCRKQLEESLKD